MKTTLSLSLALFLAIALPATAGPLTLSVLPESSSQAVGDLFSVDIFVTDVVDLISYQFDFGFNQAVLSATSVTWGPFLESGGSTVTGLGGINNGAGLIESVGAVLLGGGVSGSGILASIQFQVVGVGSSALSLVNPFLFDANFVGLDPILTGGTITATEAAVTPVPEPSTLLLTAPFALGLWKRARRRQRDSADAFRPNPIAQSVFSRFS